MLTFQILDGGDTFYCPLAGDGLLIGSSAEADIRLTEEGVAPRHARVEPLGDGRRDGYKLVDLDTALGTRVNGEHVAQVRLRLGDRIEIGRAVLILGQRVPRPATPADVVEDGRAVRALGLPRRRRRRAPAARPVLVIAVAALLAVAGAALWSERGDRLPAAYHQQEKLRQSGQFAEAGRLLGRLRHDWAGADTRRLAVLDEARTRLDATVECTAELRERLAREAPARTFAEQVDELKRLARSASAAQAEAASLLRGELTELRRAAIEARAPALPPAALAAAAGDAAREAEADASADRAELDAAELAAVLESAAAMTEAGFHAQALETLRQALAEAPPEHVASLRDRLAEQRRITRRAMAELAERAHADADAGRAREALADLRAHLPHFPPAGGASELARAIEALELRVAAADTEAPALPATTPQRTAAAAPAAGAGRSALELIEQARAAEQAGRFDSAHEALRAAAAELAERDPDFAERLRGEADDLRHLAALAARVGEAPVLASAPPAAALPRGRSGGHGDGRAPRGGDRTGHPRNPHPPGQPARRVADLAADVGSDPPALLGAAVLAFRGGDEQEAERCLARALAADPSLEPAVFGILRRGRAEPADPDGYELIGSRFVPRGELAAQKLAAKLEQRLATALRAGDAARGELLEELLAEGPNAVPALRLALERTAAGLAAKLADHPFKRRVYDRVAQQREELDRARARALELIYDEEKYFFPFKPPAVDAKTAAAYRPVQQEVDERVAEVRRLWEATAVRGRIPKPLLEDVGRWQWVRRVQAQLFAPRAEPDPTAAWALTLPDAPELSVQTFCKTPAEREAYAFHERIERFNRRQLEQLTAAEREQVAVTNAYRRMLGRHPLAVNLDVEAAARGHSEEMSKLGYFGHFSPTPGHRTPFDRMKQCGYSFGASENCAINGSAQGAHDGWLHSSGHHRNLLAASHREFGVGNSGRYWTQNFGGGDEFLAHPDFPD